MQTFFDVNDDNDNNGRTVCMYLVSKNHSTLAHVLNAWSPVFKAVKLLGGGAWLAEVGH